MGIRVTLVMDSGTDTVHKVAEITELTDDARPILDLFGLKLGTVNGLAAHFVGFHLANLYNAVTVRRPEFVGRCLAAGTVRPADVYLWIAELLVACSDWPGATVVVTR